MAVFPHVRRYGLCYATIDSARALPARAAIVHQTEDRVQGIAGPRCDARWPAARPGAARGGSAPIPWEDRPAGARDLVWRSSRNPIIPRDLLPRSNSIFNSAVVRHGEGFAGVFRVDDRSRLMTLHAGTSADGIGWHIEAEPIEFRPADARVPEIAERFEHAYDPRVTWLEDRYYVTWCNGYHGPTIGVGYTFDFRTFHQLDNAFLPFNRNGVLFPRRIGGATRCSAGRATTATRPSATSSTRRART